LLGAPTPFEAIQWCASTLFASDDMFKLTVCRQRHISGSPPSVYLFIYLFIYLSIYLFNRFHHDYNAKIRLKKNTFEQGTKTRDEGAGHTT